MPDNNSIGIGGSLQKDLNVATQALEDVALESANVAKEVSKEVFNPLAKFTKVIHQGFVVYIILDIRIYTWDVRRYSNQLIS